jgi:hypothetical protein
MKVQRVGEAGMALVLHEMAPVAVLTLTVLALGLACYRRRLDRAVSQRRLEEATNPGHSVVAPSAPASASLTRAALMIRPSSA